ncbi:MAG TPA: hypothetical protein VIV40_40075 [Kofleriaceae bacterium]
MGSRLLGYLAAFACACSSNAPIAKDAPPAIADAPAGPDLNDGARSGTRLKLTWFDFSDGARQWDGFYDAERKETCYIYRDWIDGKSYCAPDYGGSIVYTNATCTAKAAEVYRDSGCAQPPLPYAMEWEYTPCDSHPAHLYTRAAKLSLAQYYYKSSDGTCGGPYTTSASYEYYALGAEIPPTDLVEVTLGAPVGSGRLATRFYQSPDGMRLQGTVHDATLGTDCYPQIYADGATTGSCAPNARYVGYDQDSACTQHKLSINKQCAVPKYLVYYPTTACPADPPQYYTIGTLVAGSPLFYNNGSSCVATTPSTTNNYYRTGSELAVAPVERTIGTAGSRLQLIHFGDAEGMSYRSYYLYDTQKQADCYPTKLPDGTTRCIASGGYVSTFYRDSNCTQTLDVVEVDTGPTSCGAPSVPKFARKYVTPTAGSCQYGTQVFTVSTPYVGPIYQDVGTCQPYTAINAKLYSVGPQVPLAEFVSATSSIDP